MTDNRQHRHIEIDALSLSDSAIEVLISKKLNNRLISELLTHTDFQQLINAIEVYIDKKMLPQMNAMNAVYRLAEATIKENFAVEGRDEIMDFLQNAVINEDEYLRFRISERFNEIMKSLFDAHRSDKLSPEHTETIEDMKGLVQAYMTDRNTEPGQILYMLCKQLGLNAAKLNDEELRVMMKALKRSPLVKRGGRRK